MTRYSGCTRCIMHKYKQSTCRCNQLSKHNYLTFLYRRVVSLAIKLIINIGRRIPINNTHHCFREIIVARAKDAFKTNNLCFKSAKSEMNLLTNKRLLKGCAIAAVADMDSKGKGASVCEFNSMQFLKATLFCVCNRKNS